MVLYIRILLILVIIFVIIIILNYKRNYKIIKNEKRTYSRYYESICSGIGNKLMAIANLLILSEMNNRIPYCIKLLNI